MGSQIVQRGLGRQSNKGDIRFGEVSKLFVNGVHGKGKLYGFVIPGGAQYLVRGIVVKGSAERAADEAHTNNSNLH